ncbi:MAG TPA: carboxypeptidase regulatory-like domain-containing protein [Longimicrobiales bacterium]|nr:carboxypeptidase regulatory-like domain-containing protein [Longimicrobiales bacterium]
MRVRHVLVRRLAPAALRMILLALASGPGALSAQRVTGLVAEQLTLAPVGGAVVSLYRVQGDDLTEVGLAVTDTAGAFSLTAPGAGSYRVQASLEGLSSPLSQPLELTGPDDERDVALLLPSLLLQIALQCPEEAGPGSAAVVGVLHDAESDVPIPGAVVMATWRTRGLTGRLESGTDAGGRYRLCPPGDAGEVDFQALVVGEWRPLGSLEITAPAVVIHDLAVELATDEGALDVIQEQILLEAAAVTLADLRGEILDRFSGEPVQFAVVGLQGTGLQTETDARGRFAFDGIGPGSHTLEVRSLGYDVLSRPVDVTDGRTTFVRLQVAPDAVEIEGLEVTARAEAEQVTRATPFRRAIAYGEVMAREEQRGAMAYEVLRRSAPGVSVRERYVEGQGRILCIETNRRVQNFGGGCASAQVVVDGMRIPDGPEFLLRTPASEIESIEFVTPVQAQILYGIGGQTANGVVVVYTRGRGPYASPLRNRDRR